VEFTGALAELIRGPLLKDYPDLDFKNEVQIILLEATNHLLPGLPERLQAYAQAHLEKIGVEVRLGRQSARSPSRKFTCADQTRIQPRPSSGLLVYVERFPQLRKSPPNRNGRLKSLPLYRQR